MVLSFFIKFFLLLFNLSCFASIFSHPQSFPQQQSSALYQNVSSIEVLHEPLSFVLGPKGKGGAILITTKGIDEMYIPVETENISFITPLGYQITREFYSPAYDSPAKVESGIPDERVTVYWNSNVELDNQGKGYFEFYTSDSDKGQTIVVEGMTEDGKILKRNMIN
jgi:hypothetical protein